MGNVIQWAKGSSRNKVISGIVVIVLLGALFIGGFFAYRDNVAQDEPADITGITEQFNSEIDGAFEKDLRAIQEEDKQKSIVTSDRGIIYEFMYIFDENEKKAQ